ncbi:hypothetical protein [Amaricoccus sp. W119]|uniref:hypothetical protein n=1 Tax=Amaricoccus sp. W119 TaxID=3391833 RepID=UPI0039A5F485
MPDMTHPTCERRAYAEMTAAWRAVQAAAMADEDAALEAYEAKRAAWEDARNHDASE